MINIGELYIYNIHYSGKLSGFWVQPLNVGKDYPTPECVTYSTMGEDCPTPECVTYSGFAQPLNV